MVDDRNEAVAAEAAGEDNVFIHLDSYHMNIEERSMAQGIRDCGDWLGYFHLSESNRAAPGHGTIDWAEVYGAAIELAPSHADTYFNLSAVCERLGHEAQAIRHLKTYRQLVTGR